MGMSDRRAPAFSEIMTNPKGQDTLGVEPGRLDGAVGVKRRKKGWFKRMAGY